MSEGRILEGHEHDLYYMLISNLEPFKSDFGTHCSDFHYEILDEFPYVVYIIETACGDPVELRLLEYQEYQQYIKPEYQKLQEALKAIECNKPITVPEYIGKPIHHTSLEGIMDKYDKYLSGADLIAKERRRQKEVEGWTAEHDAKYISNELVQAAMCYLKVAHQRSNIEGWFEARCDDALEAWPWDEKWFKPESQIRDLVKAGALIAAQIDRLKAIR